MEKEVLQKLNEFYKKHYSECKALENWLRIKNKNIRLVDAIHAVYVAAEAKETVMVKIIEQIKEKIKVRGRSHVYDDAHMKDIDIVKTPDGNVEVVGFDMNKTPDPKGPSIQPNPRIFRKKDGQVKKPYQKAEKRFGDIGKEVRLLYPNADNNFIMMAIKAISEYAALKKKAPSVIINRLKKKTEVLDTNTFEIKPFNGESRTIIISEDVMKEISDRYYMNDYVFESNVRQFIFDLKNDPINAQPSETLKFYNLDRNTLLKYLKEYGIITKKEKLSNKDENGNPKKLTMKVSYAENSDDGDEFEVRKKKFKLKVKQLYIDLFEKNVNENLNEEDGGGGFISGGGDVGQFSQPISGIIRRDVEESTTTGNVGNYQYDVPFAGDDETLDRTGGKNHSVSINFK